MVAIFSRVTAELSPDFIENFPNQFDFNGMLSTICDDICVDITFQNQTFLLLGDWVSLGRAHNMLVSTLAVYGSTSSVRKEHTDIVSQGSRPFSALVEAAEAISRGVELQEQVQNEMTQINKLKEYVSIPDFKPKYENHNYDNISRYSQNSTGDEHASEYSTQESDDCVNEQNDENIIEDMISPHNGAGSLHSQSTSTTAVSKREVPCDVVEQSQSVLIEADSGMLMEIKTEDREHCQIPMNLSKRHNNGKVHDEKLIQYVTVSQSNDNEDGLECQECDFKTTSKSALVAHKMQLHRPIPMAKCDVCAKIFINVRYMKRHRSCHKDVYYTCDVCSKKYKVLKALKEHKKTHEKGYVKPEYKCESCPKSFCSAYLVECHVKSEHLGLKKSFLCQTCGKSFTTKHTLQQHVNAHTGIRPYQCSDCGKCFSYEAALRDHKFTHNESKSFLCAFPECKKTFRQRSALKMHEKIHKNPNQFECSECGRGFTQKQALQRHTRSHKGLKPFKCKYCGRTFGDASIIRRHMKLVHKLNKDIDKWREDIIEVAGEPMDDKEKTASVTCEISITPDETLSDVAVLPAVATEGKIITYKHIAENVRPDFKENTVENQNSNAERQLNASNIQSVLVSYNLPSHNLVLANASGTEYNQSTSSLIQYNYKPAVEVEVEIGHSEKSETVLTNSEPEIAQPEHILQEESDGTFIEREQIQFLTENLDGTFNTTVDFSKLKKNLELLTKPSALVDLNLASDQAGETLKPDGTVAEIQLGSGLDSMTKFGEIEPLSDNLGLSVSPFQYYYSSVVNQYLNMNQTQTNSADTSTDRNVH